MIKKITDAPKPCMSLEHNIPNMMVFTPGTYEHTCPSCGKKTIFTVPQITCEVNPEIPRKGINLPFNTPEINKWYSTTNL